MVAVTAAPSAMTTGGKSLIPLSLVSGQRMPAALPGSGLAGLQSLARIVAALGGKAGG